jgi:hypothetical protein
MMWLVIVLVWRASGQIIRHGICSQVIWTQSALMDESEENTNGSAWSLIPVKTREGFILEPFY